MNMDKIIIKGLRIFAYHGVNPEEKIDGQIFEIDVVMYADLKLAGESDKIEDTISYSKARKIIDKAIVCEKYNLIEKVANEVAKALFLELKELSEVEILLKKPCAPINAEFDYVAVEIKRKRSDF